MKVFDEVDLLVQVYENYLTEQGLPYVSADEQNKSELTDSQVRWIESFETLWDLATWLSPLPKMNSTFLLNILGTADQFDIIEKMSDDWQDEDEDFRDFSSDPTTIFESLNQKLSQWINFLLTLTS